MKEIYKKIKDKVKEIYKKIKDKVKEIYKKIKDKKNFKGDVQMEMKTKLITIVSILALFGPTIGSAGVDNWFGVDIQTYAYTSEDGNIAESYSTATNYGGDYTHAASESSSGNEASSNSNANGGDFVSSTSGANVQNSADTHAEGGSSATGDQTGAGVVSTAVSGIDFNYAGVDTSSFGIGDADAHTWAHAWS